MVSKPLFYLFRPPLTNPMHPSCLPPDELAKDCEWQFARRSGPGGQHRNKVESAAIVHHKPTGMVAEANERRSQAKNREVALARLRLALAVAHRTQPVAAPSPFWAAHINGSRLRVAADHANLPAMLAELLDWLAGHDCDLAAAADWLAVSKTQLVNLLATHPPALALVNRQRAALGLRTLRG